MSKKTLALAAALLATSMLSNAANAGGLRVGLGFGFPLGNFTAREHQSDTRSAYAKPGCAKSRAAASRSYAPAPVKHVKRAAPKVEVAEAPVRKIKRAPKVEVAEAPAPRPRKIAKVARPEIEKTVEIKTAKLDDKTTINDAAPSIYVPDAPAAADPKFNGTQSTPAPVTTAAITPATADAVATNAEPVKVDVVKDEPAKVEKTVEAKPEPAAKAKADLPATAKRLCRRFSAAIAGLIDVPCE